MAAMDKGSDVAPSVSLAVTPLGALSIPASALAWLTESVNVTRRRSVPAT
jgi:hypothetical protein